MVSIRKMEEKGARNEKPKTFVLSWAGVMIILERIHVRSVYCKRE